MLSNVYDMPLISMQIAAVNTIVVIPCTFLACLEVVSNSLLLVLGYDCMVLVM